MNQNGRSRSSIEFDTFAGKKVCQVLFELVLMSFRGFLFQKVFNWNALSLQISQETTPIEVAYFGNGKLVWAWVSIHVHNNSVKQIFPTCCNSNTNDTYLSFYQFSMFNS